MNEEWNRKRAEIHLGDLIRALAKLDCDSSEQIKSVASCLGFLLEWTAKSEAQSEIYDTHRYPDKPETRVAQPGVPKGFQAPPQPEVPVSLPKFKVPGTLEEVGFRTPPTPGEFADPEGDYEILDRKADIPALARSTLFTENTSRGILSAALATLRLGHEIDLSRLIEATLRGQALPRIPRLPSATLARGCQLLLDYRSSMVPYYEDLITLPGQIAQITPADKIETYTFDSDPSAAKRWTLDFERLAWHPDKKLVLAATDFGIQGRGGRAANPAGWPPFIERCKDNGSPLLVLIPWPRDRWPVGLGSYPELIHWSPFTTAAMIRRKIGLGHRIPR